MGAVEVGEDQGPANRRPLPERRKVDTKNLADSALHALDLLVDLAGGRLMNLEDRSEISVSKARRSPHELRGAPLVFGPGHVGNGTTHGYLVLPERLAS